jgi:hypothetical protein
VNQEVAIMTKPNEVIWGIIFPIAVEMMNDQDTRIA